MAITALVSVDEYRRMATDPDCEYVHGVIEERAVGELDHASWQDALLTWFREHRHAWDVRAYPELRVQVEEEHFLVPDVTVLSRKAMREQVVTVPPLAVFEILSPTDTVSRLFDKLEAYDRMGIPAIWVIDPRKNLYFRYSSGQLTPTAVFDLPGTGFSVPMSHIAELVD